MATTTEAPARANRRPSLKTIPLLILLGTLLGATAGFLLAGSPNYKAVGLIQIRPFLPGVFTDSTTPMPMFDAFVDSQIAIIKSRRTIDMAMQSPEWRQLGRGLTDKAVADFQSSLSASRDGIIVAISFLDPDPNTARTAVKSVIQSYEAIYDDANIGDENRRADILENLRNKYQTEIKRLRDSMQQDSGFGPDAVDINYRSKLQDLNRMESELQQVQLELHMIDVAKHASAPASTNDPATPNAATDALAHHNPSDASPDDNNLTAMRLREIALTEQLSRCKQEVKDLGNQKVRLDDLKAQEATALTNLNAVRSRIQQLTAENQIGGRISIISDGTTPLAPEYAPRKKSTLLGLLLGTSLAATIAFFITPRTQP